MYSAFSEVIRHALFLVSRVSLSLAENGFKYHGLFYDDKNRCLTVKYTFNGQILDETCEKFTRSPYVRALSNKQLNEIISKTTEIKSKNKVYTISLLDETPDIFTIKNTITNLSEDRLLSDVISDSNLLEKSDADSIRLVINTAIKLANSGYSIISTLDDFETTGNNFNGDNKIINFPLEKLKQAE